MYMSGSKESGGGSRLDRFIEKASFGIFGRSHTAEAVEQAGQGPKAGDRADRKAPSQPMGSPESGDVFGQVVFTAFQTMAEQEIVDLNQQMNEATNAVIDYGNPYQS